MSSAEMTSLMTAASLFILEAAWRLWRKPVTTISPAAGAGEDTLELAVGVPVTAVVCGSPAAFLLLVDTFEAVGAGPETPCCAHDGEAPSIAADAIADPCRSHFT
jgi:hypothetical protein